MIRVSCPKCKAILQVEDKHGGQVIACSNCKTSLRLPPAPPAPPVPSPPVSTASTPIPTATTAPPVANDETQKAEGTAEPSLQEKAKAIAEKLKSVWQEAKTPIKAAVIGGTSVVILSCFLCCGNFTFNSFPRGKGIGAASGGGGKGFAQRESGGSSSSSKNYLAGIDFSKGPNGEAVTKHEKDDQTIEGYTKETVVVKVEFVPQLKGTMPVQRKTTVIVNHGLTIRYWDKDKVAKKSEGHFVNGEQHGTHRTFNREGKLVGERTYAMGQPRGVHKGTLVNGKGEWSITYADDGMVDLTNTSCGGFLAQCVFVSRAADWRTMNLVKGNDEFGYLWMARLGGGNNEFSAAKLESWFGKPMKLPGAKSSEERWQYQCKDGVVELRVIPFSPQRIIIMGLDLYSTAQLP